MRKTILTLAISVIAANYSPSIKADDLPAWVFKPGIKVMDFDSKRNLYDNGFGGSLGGEYRYGNWGTELQLYQFDTEQRNSNQDVDVLGAAINQYFYLKPQSRFNPYLSVGIGHADFDSQFSHSKETQGSIGVGFETIIGKGINLWADLRAVRGIDDSTVDGVFGVGLAYRFGSKPKQEASAITPLKPVTIALVDNDLDKVSDDKDQCLNTRRGVKVDAKGCELDSDRDGVFDADDRCEGTLRGVKVDSVGCKLKVTRVEEIRLEVRFALNSSILLNDYNVEIEKLANFMKKHPELSVILEGHTDSTGAESYNQMMSTKRANSVKNALIQNFGIKTERIDIKGYGELNPIATNATTQGRALNRRVIAVLTKTIEE